MSFTAPADRRVGYERGLAPWQHALYSHFDAWFQYGSRDDCDPTFADVHDMSANVRHSGTAKRDWTLDWAAEVATVLPQDQTIRGS